MVPSLRTDVRVFECFVRIRLCCCFLLGVNAKRVKPPPYLSKICRRVRPAIWTKVGAHWWRPSLVLGRSTHEDTQECVAQLEVSSLPAKTASSASTAFKSGPEIAFIIQPSPLQP